MRRKIPRQRKSGVRSLIGPGVCPLCLGYQQTVKRIFLSQQQKERPPTNTPPALPTTSGLLSGIPSTSPPVVSSTSTPKTSETDRLPDLVVNQPASKLNVDCHPPAATNTAEDLEAASTLLSLSDAIEDPPDEDNDDNALLMPIGGINNPVDIAP